MSDQSSGNLVIYQTEDGRARIECRLVDETVWLSQALIGDTFKNPKFRDRRGKLRTFDRVVANPMWNQDWFTEADYDADELDRFPSGAGFPGKSSADCPSLRSRPAGRLRCAQHCSTANAAGQWGWVQHMHASLKADGRAAVLLDSGAASRGSGNAGTNKEKTVRQWFEGRRVEAWRQQTEG